MPNFVTFHKGQPAPYPVVFDCKPGCDPVPYAPMREGLFRLEDGDRLTVDGDLVTWVVFPDAIRDATVGR